MRPVVFLVFIFCVRGYPLPKPVVFTAPAKYKTLFDEVSYPARFIPKIHATLTSDFDGVVSEIARPLGSHIGKDQVLLTLKHTDPVYHYSALRVLSPVDGVVSSIAVSKGTRVTKGQVLATVVDPNQAKLTVEVPAPELKAIHTGLVGSFTTTGSSEMRAVKISGVSPWVDPTSGTATIELDLGKAKYDPGTLGKVTFKVDEHMGIEVPEYALIYRGDKASIRTVEKGKIRLVAVQLGKMRRGLVEIKEGLKEGATIVLRSSQFVGDGEEIATESAEGTRELK